MLDSVPSFGLLNQDDAVPWCGSELWWDIAPNDHDRHGYRRLGGWLFVSVDSPERIPAIEDAARAIRAAQSGDEDQYVPPSHEVDLETIGRLARTNVMLGEKQASYAEFFEQVAGATGIPIGASLAGLWDDGRESTDVVSVPAAGTALAVLDDLFAYHDPQSPGRRQVTLQLWSVSRGRLVMGDEPTHNSAFSMVHDYSALVSRGSTSARLDWTAIQRHFTLEFSESLGSTGYECCHCPSFSGDEAARSTFDITLDDPPFYAIPFDSGRVVVYATPRIQYELARFLERHRSESTPNRYASSR